MSLKTCRECKKEVSEQALACPQFAVGFITISQFGIGIISVSQFSVAGFALAQFGFAALLIAQIGVYIQEGKGQLVWRLTELLGM